MNPETLLTQHAGMLHRLAERFARRWGVDKDDMLQEGRLAILHAATKHDPAKGANFCTYSARWMRSKMQRHANETCSAVKPPQAHHWKGKCPVEMEHPAAGGEFEPEIWDTLTGGHADGFPAMELRDEVQHLLSRLNQNERRVIEAMYFDGKEQAEIAREWGCVKQNVNNLHRSALRKMRKADGV